MENKQRINSYDKKNINDPCILTPPSVYCTDGEEKSNGNNKNTLGLIDNSREKTKKEQKRVFLRWIAKIFVKTKP